MPEAVSPFDLNPNDPQETVAASVAPDPPMFDTHSFLKWFMVGGILLAWLLLAAFLWAARLSDQELMVKPNSSNAPGRLRAGRRKRPRKARHPSH
jgi:hypothetical protein